MVFPLNSSGFTSSRFSIRLVFGASDFIELALGGGSWWGSRYCGRGWKPCGGAGWADKTVWCMVAKLARAARDAAAFVAAPSPRFPSPDVYDEFQVIRWWRTRCGISDWRILRIRFPQFFENVLWSCKEPNLQFPFIRLVRVLALAVGRMIFGLPVGGCACCRRRAFVLTEVTGCCGAWVPAAVGAGWVGTFWAVVEFGPLKSVD